MKNRRWMGALALVVACLVRPAATRADSVLYDSVNFVNGKQAFVQSFAITTPGTVTVTLDTVPWLDTVQDLTFFFTSAAGVVGSPMPTGTESFDISAGTYYAHWFGEARGQYNLGVDELKIEFHPSVTAVPLPASFLLLLGGLGLLFGWQRRDQCLPLPHTS